jgi:transcriptional regulator with XRE-family HTH domain
MQFLGWYAMAQEDSKSTAMLVHPGNRIRRRRKAAGLTGRQLADLVGVSRNTVGNYELGRTDPSTGDLVRIAGALGCTLHELLAAHEDSDLPRFAFRAHKALSRNPEVVVKAQKYMRAYAEIEEITDTRLRSPFVALNFPRSHVPREEQIEVAADRTRSRCRIQESGPEKFVHALEALGIRSLFFRSALRGLDALSVRKGDWALMMLRYPERLMERTVFSAAHELGHLVLHPDMFTMDPDAGELDDVDYEGEADYFAGCFLVPKNDLVYAWEEENLHRLPLVHALILLKEIFRVSFWCLFQRAKQAGLTAMGHPQLLVQVKKTLGVQGAARMEDLEPHPLKLDAFAVSTRFGRLVRSAFLQEKIGVAKVAEMFQVTVDEAKEITAGWLVPEGGLVDRRANGCSPSENATRFWGTWPPGKTSSFHPGNRKRGRR